MRNIHPDVQALLDQKNVRFIFLVDIQLDIGSLAFNTSLASYNFNSKTYLGASTLGEISPIQEGSSLDPSTCTITMNALNSALLSTFLSEEYVNRDVIIHVAFLDDSNQIVGDPFIYFWGQISSLTVNYGKRASINIDLKDKLALWDRHKIKRLTHQEQQSIFAGDLGFEYAAQIADKEIIWPAAEYRG